MDRAVLLVVLVVAALAAVPLAGGRLSRLASVRLRGAALLLPATALAAAISLLWPRGEHAVHVWLNLAIYGAVLAVLWLNRSVRGAAVVAAGTVVNVVAMAANGGIMPASPAALRLAGLGTDARVFYNSTAVAHARLAWLGDAFAVPRWFPGANVFSVGDLLIAAGAVLAVLAAAGCTIPCSAAGRLGQGSSIESTR